MADSSQSGAPGPVLETPKTAKFMSSQNRYVLFRPLHLAVHAAHRRRSPEAIQQLITDYQAGMPSTQLRNRYG